MKVDYQRLGIFNSVERWVNNIVEHEKCYPLQLAEYPNQIGIS